MRSSSSSSWSLLHHRHVRWAGGDNKKGYEPIPDHDRFYHHEDDEQHPNKSSSSSKWKLAGGRMTRAASFMMILVVVMATLMAVANMVQVVNRRPSHAPATATSPGETIPTLLSLRHAETKAHLNALENEVYEMWKQAIVAGGEDDDHRNLQQQHQQQQQQRRRLVWLDRTEISVRGTLTVTFADDDENEDETSSLGGSTGIRDDDILVLECVVRAQELRPAETFAPRVLEVATMAQVRATTTAQAAGAAPSQSNRNENEDSEKSTTTTSFSWRLDPFPVLRHEACRFVLYRIHKNDENNDNDDDDTSVEEPDPSTTTNQSAAATASGVAVVVTAVDATDWVRIHHAHARPTHIHWAIGAPNDPTRLTAQFTTGDELPHGTPVVQYWPASKKDQFLEHRHHHHSAVLPDFHATTKVTGTTTTYTATDLCHAPANVTGEPGRFVSPGRLHTVRLTELQLDTEYYYQVGLAGGQGVVWSDTYTIRSPPPIGIGSTTASSSSSADAPQPQPFSYLVYGDQGCPANGWGMGSQWTTAMATREIIRPKQKQQQQQQAAAAASATTDDDEDETTTRSSDTLIRAVHHLGDLSYAMGAAHIWDEWLTMIQPFATAVPLMVVVGNHEYDYFDNYATTNPNDGGGAPGGVDISGETSSYHPVWGNFYNDSGGECGVPVAKRFAMPQTTSATNNNNNKTNGSSSSNGVFWYSYKMGPVHTTVISSEHDLSAGSRQYEWLQHDLAAVNRTATPWLVVESHRPMYQGEAWWANNAVGIAMRFELEDLLVDYAVDLFLAGHYHSYFRTCDGLYRGRCHSSPRRGRGRHGGLMHITIGTAGGPLEYNKLFWNCWWAAKHILGTYGYGRITVANATALHFEFVKAGDETNNDTTAGDTLDDVWIYRDEQRRRQGRRTTTRTTVN